MKIKLLLNSLLRSINITPNTTKCFYGICSQNNRKFTSLEHGGLSTEFLVGLFSLVTMAAAAWLAIGLGGVSFFNSGYYNIKAEFDNISGLKNGASVEIAGVQIGEVTDLELKDPEALVVMKIRNEIKIHDDDIASIRTKGIIGDRFVKISRGSSDMVIEPGGTMLETEAVVDFEDIIGKIVHSFTGDENNKQ